MAYSAAVSLKQIVNQVPLHSDPFSVLHLKSQLHFLKDKLSYIQSFLQTNSLNPSSSKSSIHNLESKMIEAICEAEDVIESHISTHILSNPSEYTISGDHIFSRELEKLLEKFDSILKSVEIDDRSRGRENLLEKRHLEEPVNFLSKFVQSEKILVGRKDDLDRLQNKLIYGDRRCKVVWVVGMIGIGKTTLVKELFHHQLIGSHFDCSAWVTIRPHYDVEQIFLDLKSDLVRHSKIMPVRQNDDHLGGQLFGMLVGRRYLIVLDNVSDIVPWADIRRYFPDHMDGSRIIVTTRIRAAAPPDSIVHQVRLLDEDESWDLLCYAALGKNSCPYNLEKIGKTIARNCEGLPLKIHVLGNLLPDMSPQPEIWSTLADDPKIESAEMLKVMQNLDHEQLPQHIKACFFYMLAFPQNHKIPTSELIKLWVVEGFLEPKGSKNIEDVAEECLGELLDRSLILAHRSYSKSGIKTCSIHSAIYSFYARAASEHKIFHAIESCREKGDQSHRRFSIQKNILFAIKKVSDSIVCVKTARSLLCTGPFHPYPLRVCLDFRLLKVLNMLTVRFFTFPNEVLKLVLLRFLAFTLNRVEVPASVSKLWNLQVLIVRQTLRVKSPTIASYLPIEIWNMQELRHLEVMGSDIPAPPYASSLLPNLLTLSGVSDLTCTQEVFGKTPNLKKLGIRIELAWDSSSTPLRLFDHLLHLHQLKSFKCVVMNHVLGVAADIQSNRGPVFPSSLQKLTLSGCGYLWESIPTIASLPNLEVLKLRCHAFRGPEWEQDEGGFFKLQRLLLEDLDIEQLIVDAYGESFPRLQHLAIQHCYKLHEIPRDFGEVPTLETIKLL